MIVALILYVWTFVSFVAGMLFGRMMRLPEGSETAFRSSAGAEA